MKILLHLAATTLLALSLVGCNASRGTNSNFVAPASMDDVKLTFAGSAFTMEFDRNEGVPGDESGSVEYVRGFSDSFRVAQVVGSSNLGYTVYIPLALQEVSYTYKRTGSHSARLEIHFSNSEVLPTVVVAEQIRYVFEVEAGAANMFWGGVNYETVDGVTTSEPARDATTLTMDLLFNSNGEVLNDVSARVDPVYVWGLDPNTGESVQYSFDTTDVAFRNANTNGLLPAGYQAEYNKDGEYPDTWVSDSVWTSLDNYSVVLWETLGGSANTGGTRYKVAFQRNFSVDAPEIPNVDRPRDRGTISVSEAVIPEGYDDLYPQLYGGWGPAVPGTYAYEPLTGSNAVLKVSYVSQDNGPTTKTFYLTFDNSDGGVYVDELGQTGEFTEQLFETL